MGLLRLSSLVFGVFIASCAYAVPTSGPASEDCLTINVFRPAGLTNKDQLPVMVWTYGGGFDYQGTPILYVNFNYRLGPLGFPVGREAMDAGILNLGLKDPLTAMQWVQNNIAAFGGDKDKVTLFAESAGSISLSILFLNSGIEKLARAAIFESGSAASNPTFTALHGQTDWNNFVLAVPEYASLTWAAEKILELYPNNPALGSPYGTGNETFGLNSQFKRLAAINGDMWFQSQRRAWSQLASKAGVKNYAYLFTDAAPSSLFPPVDGDFGASAAAKLLASQMVDYWISFATSLDPNDGLGLTRPNWPEYTVDGKNLLQLNSTNLTVIEDDYRSTQINFINSNPALFRH
ncbi:Alpha/Beta hydrolase protein [Mycena maculata]|uniref:Alpha/Beta hydrolase protein n=1 Tax=Mycena maculata TaxID=230809 RepID=A0AAD7J017_9AGAR|nr:Alpha/Beta hydrolase protein [Mycena maculata]